MNANTDAMDEFEETTAKPAFYTVAIFIVNLAYGGPEEGGWWYKRGHPVEEIPEGINPHDLVTVFAGESNLDAPDEAHKWAEALQLQLDAGPNKGRREISSVLSTGRYCAVVCEGWPRAYPETRPHYE